MTNAIDAQAQAGAAVYSRTVLAVYDWFVLGFSNRVLWRCPTVEIAALYDRLRVVMPSPVVDLKPYLSSIPPEKLRRGWLDAAEAAAKTPD